MTEEEYVSHDGTHCPVCRSSSIESRLDEESMTEKVECLACNSEWRNIYSLVGYDELYNGREIDG